MTKLKTAIAIAVSTLFTGAAFAQSNYEIEQRDRAQQARINQGVQSGQLTSREADRLMAERAQIERLERRARADGVLSQGERARIDNAQDHLRRDIYRETHDRQVAGSNGRPWDRNHGWDRRNGNDHRFGNDHRYGNGNRYGNDHRFGNDRRHFDHNGRPEHAGNRDGVRGEHNGSHGNGMTPRTGNDGQRGRSDQAPGRQPHAQQTPSQSNHVQQAQTQRTWTRPAQVASAGSTVSAGRQAGNSGRRTR